MNPETRRALLLCAGWVKVLADQHRLDTAKTQCTFTIRGESLGTVSIDQTLDLADAVLAPPAPESPGVGQP